MRINFILLFFLTGCSSARIVKEIKETENQLHEHVGFYLYDLASKKVKVDYNGAKYFTPASNTKIFTLYTSLKLLGDSISSLKYVTKGDSLIFQGMGDPSFLYQNVFDNGRTFNFLKQFQGKLFFASNNFQTVNTLTFTGSWSGNTWSFAGLSHIMGNLTFKFILFS